MRIGNLYIGKESERIKELETSVEKLKRKLDRAELERDVLKEERDEAAAVLKLKLELEGEAISIDARSRTLDLRERYLTQLAESMKFDKAPSRRC